VNKVSLIYVIRRNANVQPTFFFVAKQICLTVGTHAFKNNFTWDNKPHVMYLRPECV